MALVLPLVRIELLKVGVSGARRYVSCPPRPPPGGSKSGHVPPNPCMPIYHHGKDTWKRYRNIFLFIALPLIIIQSMHALSHSPPHKTECSDYEYMRRRTKRFPWGNGQESFFHNPDVNFLPGECEPPPLDCD